MSGSTVWRIAAVGISFSLLILFSPPVPRTVDQPFAPGSAAAAGLMASAARCPDRQADDQADIAGARRSMLCLVNYARRQNGLRPYRREGRLDWSAARKGRDIIRCQSFSHNACGRGFDHWIRRSGYLRANRAWATGENIAWGSGSLGNVRRIFEAWMQSPGHRRAILDRTFREVGVGVARGRMRGLAGSRVWVLHFGYCG